MHKPLPFLEKEGAPPAIKAGFRRAQLLPERLAAGCQFVTNFNESILPSFRGSRSENPESIAKRAMMPDGFRACAQAGASRNDDELTRGG
jgi:hypothetical protein